MQFVSSEMQAALAAEVSDLTVCCRIQRQDGVVIGLTEHAADLVVDGLTYQSTSGLASTATVRHANLAVDGGEVLGVLSSGALTEADLLAGRYDGASIRLFWVSAAQPETGSLTLAEGTFGEITLQDGQFRAEVRGLSQALGQQFIESYSPTCRASFGDSRCKVNLDALLVEDAISASADRSHLILGSVEDSGSDYRYGHVQFLSGANAGLGMEIKWMQGRGVTLTLPMPFAIGIGDTVRLTPGCDKRFVTCQGRFNNAVNFRGEPHMPGTQRLLQTAATR